MDRMVLVVKKCGECGTGIMCDIDDDPPKECKEHTQIQSLIKHINCGGLVDFDSCGNYKCRKCGFVSKDKKYLEVFGR